jgi:predicted Zn-dependent protease
VLYAAALASERLRDFARADNSARQLLTLVAGNLAGARQARLLAMEIALAEGAAVSTASPKDPGFNLDPSRRPEMLLLARLRMQEGQPALAVELLQTWVTTHPKDAPAWQTLATAYGATGQNLRAVRAEGEVQMAHLDYAGAVDRFKAARSYSEKVVQMAADHIDASIIDTRLRQAESLLREQVLER